MESGQGEQKIKAGWKPCFGGFLLGMAATLLALVIIVLLWGPRGENMEVDLYSGSIIRHEWSLWKRTHTQQPKEPHVEWAIQQQNPVKSWYRVVSSSSKGWFGKPSYVDTNTRSYVYSIYSVQIPKNKRSNCCISITRI